jgi:hypothetical protein
METLTASRLSDAELLAAVRRLAHSEREATASLVSHIAELDARRLYLGEGFSSMFTYCTGALHLSEHEAYNRIETARAAQRFPVLLELLARGALNLTSVRLLAQHLTEDNHEALVAAASYKSKREVEELLARRFPRPDVAPLVRKLPAPMQVAVSPTAPAVVPTQRRPVVTPLAADRYEVRFTASAAMKEKLRQAQDLLRHSIADGDIAQVFDRALTVLLEDLARKKLAATSQPRHAASSSGRSRHIPAQVKRTVWLRDGSRCTFVGNGRRCEERGFLEFHHVRPYAAGGEATVDNIRLVCRKHNAHEAELYFGPTAGGGEKDFSGTRSGPSRPSPEGLFDLCASQNSRGQPRSRSAGSAIPGRRAAGS